nr:VWA domain-containing protein [Euryhalocaulis caribicus]
MTAPIFHRFFTELRQARIPASIREYLTLLEGLEKGAAERNIEDFYYLSRATLVKDERNLDKFDRVFSHVFKGVEDAFGDLDLTDIPEDWLKAFAEKNLSPEEMAEIESLGGWDKLMETLAERLKEQEKRHEGGNKMIGTGGTSPFGNSGYNPEGVRIGGQSRHKKAVKVWEKRQYKNLDGERELGTRNMKVALRRLRKFAREGARDELDLDGTIRGTAKQGYLDLQMRPERRNAVKVLTLFDVGGSMDPHISQVEALFSAARAEFKHLEYYYFHNCPYEGLWQNNLRRRTESVDTWDVLRRFPSDYKLVLVGDASMSPYEIAMPGGSVEHYNEEAGAIWLKRMAETWPSLVWLNPVPERYWDYTASIGMVQEIIGEDRMFPLTLPGLDNAMKTLTR